MTDILSQDGGRRAGDGERIAVLETLVVVHDGRLDEHEEKLTGIGEVLGKISKQVDAISWKLGLGVGAIGFLGKEILDFVVAAIKGVLN